MLNIFRFVTLCQSLICIWLKNILDASLSEKNLVTKGFHTFSKIMSYVFF